MHLSSIQQPANLYKDIYSPNSSLILREKKDTFLLPLDKNLRKRNASKPSFSSLKNLVSGSQKRHDQAITMSWARKQDETRNKYMKAPPATRATYKPSSLSPQPLTRAQGRYVVHLASEMDQSIHKVPLYKKDVFTLRNENAQTLKKIISEKEDYANKYNKIAQSNRFKQFRSSSAIMDEPDSSIKSGGLYSKTRIGAKGSSLSTVSLQSSPTILKDRANSIISQIPPNLASSWASNSTSEQAIKPNLLDGLEQIYYQDLSKQNKCYYLPPGLNVAANVRKTIPKKNLDLINYKHYFQDPLLMSRLSDPYAKKLPFEKPTNGNIRNQKARELGEIETKAEILRSIRHIDESMVREVSPTSSLPKIRQASFELASKDRVKLESQKYSEKPNVKSALPKKNFSIRDLQVMANYVSNKH